MDQGTEWVLMLHVHEGLALSRKCSDKQLLWLHLLKRYPRQLTISAITYARWKIAMVSLLVKTSPNYTMQIHMIEQIWAAAWHVTV